MNRELGIDDEELRKKHAILREYVEYSIKLWKNSDEAKDRRRAREIAMEIDEPEPRFRAIFSLASQTGIPQTYITAFKIAESMEDRREQLECVSNLNTTLSIAAHREKYANVPNYILNCVAVPPEGIQLILAKLTLINKKWAEVLKDKIHE